MNSKSIQISKSVLFCISFTGLLVIGSFFKSLLPLKFERFAYGIIGTVIAFLVTYMFLFYDKKSFRSIGFYFERATLVRFIKGILIGILITALILLPTLLFTEIKIEWNSVPDPGSFFLWTAALIPLAWMEEIAFRGYPFINLQKHIGLIGTQFLIAILFALYHVAGGQPVLNSFMGPGVWAFIFGMAAVISKGIALPTGIHYAANLTQAALGMKNDFGSLWTLNYSGHLSDQQAQQKIEWIGYATHIGLFVIMVTIMFFYVRNNTSFISMKNR